MTSQPQPYSEETMSLLQDLGCIVLPNGWIIGPIRDPIGNEPETVCIVSVDPEEFQLLTTTEPEPTPSVTN